MTGSVHRPMELALPSPAVRAGVTSESAPVVAEISQDSDLYWCL